MAQTTVELQPIAPSSESIERLTSHPSTQVRDEPVPSQVDDTPPERQVSKTSSAVVIGSVTFVTASSTFLTGLITVAIPTIAADVDLAHSLLLWPGSIFSLVCGCTLLISGSLSDVFGSRLMYLLGCLLQSAFSLACGLAQTGFQLLIFRAFAGLALSICLPSAVSIISSTFPQGSKARSAGFSCMGGGQPIGFALGLVLGGVLAGTIGWRWGFYFAAILNAIVMVAAIWGFPKNPGTAPEISWQRIRTEIDWIGALIASTALAMLSYVFSTITSSTSNIKDPVNITLLTTSIALFPAFSLWVHRQEKLDRPALIPNSLWRNRAFTSICLCCFLTWATFNSLEQLLTFYFQYVQGISPLDTALRFLPGPISGVLANFVAAYLVHRTRADFIVNGGSLLAVAPPLIMALASPRWVYWAGPFPATVLNPISADALYTVANLLITSLFSTKTQGLAGGVFNTVSQIGKSVGLALSAVIANTVTANGHFQDQNSPRALLEGYKAAFWFCLAVNVAVFSIGIWGLRKIGKVGQKLE